MQYQRKQGFYEKYIKRVLDISCSLLAFIVFGWLYFLIAIAVRIYMGRPVLFRQPRAGMIGKDGKERIFNIYKFRSMTEAKDEEGNLLPDEQRLTEFGRMLRATSLDELPEAINILKGDMSVIGPRPQMVRNMVFMSENQRMRHTAKPGLSGLAQVKGRNAITWEERINWDLKYIENISLLNDVKIVCLTIRKAFGKIENSAELGLGMGYGETLLKAGKITKEEYERKQAEAKILLE